MPNTTGFITTPEFNRLTKISFDARMTEARKSLQVKVKTVSQKDTALDVADKNREKVKKLQTYNLSYFACKNYFGANGSQHYLVSQLLLKPFITLSGKD